MSSLEPSGGRRLTRRQREQRAYRLVVAGGVAAVATVAGFVLALIGLIGYSLPVLALIVTLVCLVLFRRIVSP